MNRAAHIAAQQALVDEFNRVHAIGAAVILTKDTGEVRTKTRSAAQVLSGHSAVVWLEGVAGCYALDRVRADDEQAPGRDWPDFNMQEVRSSNILKVGYHADSNTLAVLYKGGILWHYSTVAPEVHQELMAAPSVGAFVQARIKPVYPARKV